LRWTVPGWPQAYWGQRERAWAFAGGALAALLVGVLAWGTIPGAGLVAAAMLLHAASIADAIEQGAFPGFGRVVPRVAGAVLVLALYGPLLVVALALAYPVGGGVGAAGDGYLVNRWAYRSGPPRCGDWVCFRRPEDGSVCLGRMLAGSGQEVNWFDGAVRVDGREVPWWTSPPLRSAAGGSLRVPEGLVWVESWTHDRSGATFRADGMLPEAAIAGRAWAQHWPILSRRLMPAAGGPASGA
jgi:hypothetical protein